MTSDKQYAHHSSYSGDVAAHLLINVCIDGWKYNEINIYMPLWKENMPDAHILRFKLYENVRLPIDCC